MERARALELIALVCCDHAARGSQSVAQLCLSSPATSVRRETLAQVDSSQVVASIKSGGEEKAAKTELNYLYTLYG